MQETVGQRVPKALTILEEGRARGLHLGGQLFVSLDREVMADLAFGEAQPGEPMSDDHWMLWLSSSKPITAIAVAKLWEEDLLDLDDPVARFIPEFGVRGKETITLRHLLTHTGGIRVLDVGWPKLSWDEIIRDLSEMKIEPRWIPGEKAGYHLTSSWFVLGEVIQRITGEQIAAHLRERVLEPAGMSKSWVGVPDEVFQDNRELISPLFDTRGEPAKPFPWTDREHMTHPSPGAGGVGPVRELGRLYQILLDGGRLEGGQLVQPQTASALVAGHRIGLFDHTFRRTLDWGLGFVLNSAHYGQENVPYGYGEHASSRVFGHSGYRSSTAFADPRHGLVVSAAVNGTPSEDLHRDRFHRLATAIYEDLGLSSRSGD